MARSMPDQVDLIIGIDPGKKTGVAWLDPHDRRTRPLGTITGTETWPLDEVPTKVRDLVLHLEDADRTLFAVERPVWFAHQKERATGYGAACLAFGFVTGVFAGLDLRWVEYDPNQWRRAINAPGSCSKAVAHGSARWLVAGNLGSNHHQRDASCLAVAAAKDHAP